GSRTTGSRKLLGDPPAQAPKGRPDILACPTNAGLGLELQPLEAVCEFLGGAGWTLSSRLLIFLRVARREGPSQLPARIAWAPLRSGSNSIFPVRCFTLSKRTLRHGCSMHSSPMA